MKTTTILKSTLLLIGFGMLLGACNNDPDLEEIIDALTDNYDTLVINMDTDLGIPPRGEDCYRLDLNQDDLADIEVCSEGTISNGGYNISESYISILNSSLAIATTYTTDSLHKCRVMQNDTLYPYMDSYRMDKEELACPADAEYSVTAFADQSYPTVFNHYALEYSDHEFSKDVRLLNYSNTSSNNHYDYAIQRSFWNVKEKYLIFKIDKNGVATEGWMQLSGSFVHSIGIRK